MTSMRRDFGALSRRFDVLVVGGGVYGACIARLAAQSGWSVALIERDDFGGGVSHNSLKIVHGGFRYLQHFDLPRIRESVAAQRAWLRAAPHLVRPIRCVIPAYGYGTRGPFAFAAGVCAFQALTSGRNRGLAAASRLPTPGLLSRGTLLASYPEVTRADVTGGAYWYDAQMLDANRLTLECILDASDHGAIVVNHVEAIALRAAEAGVEGVIARDGLSGRELDVRARVTVNASGPAVERLLATGPKALRHDRGLVWTRNVNVVTRRVFETADAVGVGSQRASDAAVGRSKRLFFVTPWQDCSIIGTSHVRHEGEVEQFAAAVETDVEGFLAEINEALPDLGLDRADLRYVHSGLTPAEDEVERLKRSTVIEHGVESGIPGLVSVLGIKYTTAPIVAEQVVGAIARALGDPPRRHADFATPLPSHPGEGVSPAVGSTASNDAAWAARIYGSTASDMFRSLPRDELTSDEHAFRCRIVYGVEHELVVTLRDAVFRATDHAERGILTTAQLTWCADTLQERLGWSAERRAQELSDVEARLIGSRRAS
jgi:glycerol-3-phosphate dehydrogenase